MNTRSKGRSTISNTVTQVSKILISSTDHNLLHMERRTTGSDSNMLFLWHSSVDNRQNNLFSKFPVNSDFAFVSYACFTVSYCCIDHYAQNYHVNMTYQQFQRWFCQTNEFARNILHTYIVIPLLRRTILMINIFILCTELLNTCSLVLFKTWLYLSKKNT